MLVISNNLFLVVQDSLNYVEYWQLAVKVIMQARGNASFPWCLLCWNTLFVVESVCHTAAMYINGQNSNPNILPHHQSSHLCSCSLVWVELCPLQKQTGCSVFLHVSGVCSEPSVQLKGMFIHSTKIFSEYQIKEIGQLTFYHCSL